MLSKNINNKKFNPKFEFFNDEKNQNDQDNY